MEIRLFFIFYLIFNCCQLFSQGTEQQRKYVIPKEISKEDFLASTQTISELSVHYHSIYTYYDLYLESPDHLLYNNGFGLRFRKRIISDSLASYSLQLKNEMTALNDTRLEIEEAELDFYKVLVKDTFIDLTMVLDTIFMLYNSQATDYDQIVFQRNIALVQEWIKLKIDSPIAPFQFLKYFNPTIFNSESLKLIQPFICCKSIRQRGHVYLDPKNDNSELKNISLNKFNQDDLPSFFKEHPDFNWIMELSYDMTVSKVITGIFSLNEITISEFEVENKYMDKAIGTKLMDLFELFLINELKVRKEYDSKYKQMVKKLLQ
jgi:hypothetical protein